jgi:hypothetical protein
MSEAIIFNRIWAMPDSATFSIKPIRELVYRYISLFIFNEQPSLILDPFVGNSPFKKVCKSNDLNPGIEADSHLDAIEFLKTFDNSSIDLILFDPPYSVRQVSECYKGIGKNVTQEDTRMTFYSNIKDEMNRVLKIGGYVISCGWTTNGMGINRGFEIKEILIVPHGGHKNDTLVTVEKKVRCYK